MVPHRGSGVIRGSATCCTARRLVVVHQRQRLGRLLEVAGRTAGGARFCVCVRVRGDARGRHLAAVGVLRELEVRFEVRL